MGIALTSLSHPAFEELRTVLLLCADPGQHVGAWPFELHPCHALLVRTSRLDRLYHLSFGKGAYLLATDFEAAAELHVVLQHPTQQSNPSVSQSVGRSVGQSVSRSVS